MDLGIPVPDRCPKCGGSAVVPILYGLPGPKAFEAAERGEVVLGGCLIPEPPLPRWACRGCGTRWPSSEEAPFEEWSDGVDS
jgi:hypothetical protein